MAAVSQLGQGVSTIIEKKWSTGLPEKEMDAACIFTSGARLTVFYYGEMMNKTFLSKSLMALFLAGLLFNVAALPVRAETRYDLQAEHQYGATGYPVVVPSKEQDGYFLEPYQEAETAKRPDIFFLGNTGLYEYNGQVIYLMFSKQQKVALVTHNYKNSDGTYSSCILYCDAQGRVREYTEESKPAIEVEIAEQLAQTEAEVQTLYGAVFFHRNTVATIEKYEFANAIKESLEDCPANSIRIIADATQATTGKPLRFQSIYTDSDGNKSASWWVDGTYSPDSNTVQTSGSKSTTTHELGHAMESVLNKTSGGKLRQDFTAMNGGNSYNLDYYYNGGTLASQDGGVPPCFKSGYSATSFSEDFADTFADAMNYSSTELQDAVNCGDVGTEYLQKVLYVKQLFNQYAGAEIFQ